MHMACRPHCTAGARGAEAPCAAVQPPRFEFYDPQTPIYTSPRFLPPAKLIGCKISDAIVSHGAYLHECTVDNAIIGLRARIDKGCTIRVRPSRAPLARAPMDGPLPGQELL